VLWSPVDDVLRQGGDVVSCSLPMNEDDTELVVGSLSRHDAGPPSP
jgi:hypothetical protein